ncbi:unnamed protein product, partial [Polarella glacialis]
VAAAYAMGDYGRFMRLYLGADFMSAVILTPLVNLVRQRQLWLMVNSSVPMRRDKLLLEDMSRRLAFIDDAVAEEFLTFHGLEVIELGTGQKLLQLPARTGANKFDVMFDEVRQAAFNEKLGNSYMPVKCEFPRSCEGLLRKKFEALPLDRVDIVFGAADGWRDQRPEPRVPPSPSLSMRSGSIRPAHLAAAVAHAAANAASGSSPGKRQGPQGAPVPLTLPAAAVPSSPVLASSPAARRALAAASPAQALSADVSPPALETTPLPRRKRRSSVVALAEVEDDSEVEVVAVVPAPRASAPSQGPGKMSAKPSPFMPSAVPVATEVPGATGGFGASLFQFNQAVSSEPALAAPSDKKPLSGPFSLAAAAQPATPTFGSKRARPTDVDEEEPEEEADSVPPNASPAVSSKKAPASFGFGGASLAAASPKQEPVAWKQAESLVGVEHKKFSLEVNGRPLPAWRRPSQGLLRVAAVFVVIIVVVAVADAVVVAVAVVVLLLLLLLLSLLFAQASMEVT